MVTNIGINDKLKISVILTDNVKDRWAELTNFKLDYRMIVKQFEDTMIRN